MKSTIYRFGFLCLFFLLIASAAFSETALVVTPGGPLNMRKNADAKSSIVISVPNHAAVEVEEEAEEWTKITYKNKTGYVKTEFLKIPSHLVGQTVYADLGTILLRAEPDERAQIIKPVGTGEPLLVLEVEESWMKLSNGEATGYACTDEFLMQKAEPSLEINWIEESAVVVEPFELKKGLQEDAQNIGALVKGDTVIITLIEANSCLVETEYGFGYAPVSSLALSDQDEAEGSLGSFSQMDAALIAREAVSKRFKSFGALRTYWIASEIEMASSFPDPFYKIRFYSDADQYLYCALVNANTGDASFAADYSSFAVLPDEGEMLEKGTLYIEAELDGLTVGETVDFQVTAWTRAHCEYTLFLNEQKLFSTSDGKHFQASYRLRQEGNYRLSVTVADETDFSVTEEVVFSVGKGSETYQPSPFFSQKDGWWKDKKYRNSSLDKSGCAIFTLSHALSIMGYTVDDILPENLAKTYALCLTNEGTNNERLITESARDFGFATQRNLIKDKEKMVSLLQDGALFSFSIVKGHIALVSGISDDGTMIRVIDSAPTATYERIKNAAMYYEWKTGIFREATDPADIPGAQWFMDTDSYGGLEYYLPIDYVVNRGVRLIQQGE